jgi:hypothetical protein
MASDLSSAAILDHLNELIRLQQARMVSQGQRSRKPADETRDWLAINFLFRVGREYQWLSDAARAQLDVIFHGWSSAESLSLEEFTAMLEQLRALIALDAADFRAA